MLIEGLSRPAPWYSWHMTGENRIVAFGANESSQAGANGSFGQAEPMHDGMPESGYASEAGGDGSWDSDGQVEVEAPTSGASSWLPALLAGGAALAWTVFFGMARSRTSRASLPPKRSPR